MKARRRLASQRHVSTHSRQYVMQKLFFMLSHEWSQIEAANIDPLPNQETIT